MKKSNKETSPLEDTLMSDKIDYKEISKLVSFLEEKKLTHFELEVKGFKIKITRAVLSFQNQEMPTISNSSSRDEIESLIPAATAEPQDSSNNVHYISSPMVGTFYRAPDPNSPPFVEVGDPIKKSQTLCIIEAMKLMNEIESDVDGVIADIYVENGRPVEYGQRLFAIEPGS